MVIRMASDPDDFDDQTIVDGLPVSDGDIITPVELPRCSECGSIVLIDSFVEPSAAIAAGILRDDRCVRSYDGHFWYCPNFSKDRVKIVFLKPR